MVPAKLEQNAHGIFEIHWRENGKAKQKSTGTRTRDEAEEVLYAWNEQFRKRLAKSDSTKLSNILDAYWTAWAQDTISSATTWSHIKLLKESFGFLDARELTTLHIQTYMRKRRKGQLGCRPVGDGTLRREMTILNAAINHAIDGRILGRDDVIKIPLPPQPGPRQRYLKLDEIERLVQAATDMRDGDRLSRVERFIWLALHTGARREAIIKLTWDRVDLQTRMIDYHDPKLRVTKKRRSTVPISDALWPVIQRAHAERKGDYVLDTTGQLRSAFDRTVLKAGLKDVTPHTLRHTWATQASMHGVQLYEIARVLGNSMDMVERVYAKHDPEYLRTAVNTVYGRQNVA